MSKTNCPQALKKHEKASIWYEGWWQLTADIQSLQ